MAQAHAIIDIGTGLDGDDRRLGADRVGIDRPSTVRVGGRPPNDVMVEDLSPTGFRFRSDMRLPVGTRLHVGLAGSGIAQGRVVRVKRGDDGDLHGCEFLEPLTPYQWQKAFTAGAVVDAAFPTVAAPAHPERDTRWPRPVRAAVMLGGGLFSWLALVGLGTLFLR